MTEVYNPEALHDPESVRSAIDLKFEQAEALRTSGVKGYIIEHHEAKASYVRLFKRDADYDLMIGRPLPGSETPPNVDYWIITLRWRNYLDHGNEDMLVLKNKPNKFFEDIGNFKNGSPIDGNRTVQLQEFIQQAELRDLSSLGGTSRQA